MTFLVDYVSDVRQASCISYVDVFHVILPSDAQYLTLASHVKRLQLADIICQQSPCVGTVQQYGFLVYRRGSKGGDPYFRKVNEGKSLKLLPPDATFHG